MQEEEVLLPAGGCDRVGDGVGFILAGGLAVLEPMTLPQRIAAVNAARNKHAIIGGSRGQGPAEMPGAG